MFAVASALVVIGCAISSAQGPMLRSRVDKFAHRHDLTVTAANGSAVIRYLATTRRWRAAGVAGGYLVPLAATLPASGVRLDAQSLLAGWFAGALAAEARLAWISRTPAPERATVTRRPTDYLPGAVWALVPLAAAADIAIAAVMVASGAFTTAAAVRAGVGLAVAGLTALAQRAVLRRPGLLPADHAGDDLLDADNAIRSRSLHVLSAAGATLVFYCALGQFNASEHTLLLFTVDVTVTVVGCAVAIRPWRGSRRGVAPLGRTA